MYVQGSQFSVPTAALWILGFGGVGVSPQSTSRSAATASATRKSAPTLNVSQTLSSTNTIGLRGTAATSSGLGTRLRSSRGGSFLALDSNIP